MSCGYGSAGIFIDDHIMMSDVCTMHAMIRGEHGHAAALLWCRHASNCGLAIGPR